MSRQLKRKQLKKIKPRYVAIVEKPQNIGRDYVFDFNRLAREVDDDASYPFLHFTTIPRDLSPKYPP